VILRIVEAPKSATKTSPALSQVTLTGPLKRAAEPQPSLLPQELALPARVVTTPAGVIRRMVWFSRSATMTFPAASQATPVGKAKRAAPPVPSALPDDPASPASALMSPSGLIRRMVKFPASAT
jgi:hypothetical protein